MTGLTTIGIWLLQLGIAAVFLAAIRRRQIPAAVNAVAAFGATLLPLIARNAFRIGLGRPLNIPPEVTLWIAAAGLLHAYGMLGPYDSVRWWDWVTHTLSAGIIAAFVYGSLLVVPERGGLPVPDAWIWLLTVGSTLVVGVVWELVELVARGVADTYDIEPVLVQYGWRDTVLDLVFDGVGALLIVLLDIRLFVPVARQLPTPGQVLLLGGGVVLGTSTVLLVVQLVLPGESF